MDTRTRVLIANTNDDERREWLYLPFSEEDFDALLEQIGIEREENGNNWDSLMNGDDISAGWFIVDYDSDFLLRHHFEDIHFANELVDRIEDLYDDDGDLIHALIEDGDELEDAIQAAEDGSALFYSNTDLSDLAEQYVDEGIWSKDFLMDFIDFRALGQALADDGYVEVNGGVLRRD